MTALLDVQNLVKEYRDPRGRVLRAVDNVSFSLEKGEVLGLVGESGCGKSTLGRSLMRLAEPTSGRVLLEGRDLAGLSGRELTQERRNMQMVFQDPFGSLNPRHRVGTIIGEPLSIHGIPNRKARVAELLGLVGLPDDAAERFPHEFSGGQRQRIAIARALALEPKIILADEPVSALDVSIQSQIINLIADLRARLGLSMIFITHDLSVVRHVSDRIAVMYFGRIIELAPTQELFADPRHPYTKALLSAIPLPPAARGATCRERILLTGELPDPTNPPAGCPFHTRCAAVMPVCRTKTPTLEALSAAPGSRAVACLLERAPALA